MMRWPSSSWIETWTILQMLWCGLRKSPNQGNKARCGADVVRFSGRSANHTSESGTADGAVSVRRPDSPRQQVSKAASGIPKLEIRHIDVNHPIHEPYYRMSWCYRPAAAATRR